MATTLGPHIIAEPDSVITPDEARRRILAAIDDAKGSRTRAAEALGEGHRNLLRLIEHLDLWPAVDALCAEKGYPVQPGRPRGEAPGLRKAAPPKGKGRA